MNEKQPELQRGLFEEQVGNSCLWSSIQAILALEKSLVLWDPD